MYSLIDQLLESKWGGAFEGRHLETWDVVQEEGYFEVTEDKDDDGEVRQMFVGLQCVFEDAMVSGLRNGQITEAAGSIHAPSPPTPLCNNETEDIAGKLILRPTQAKLETVIARTSILHAALNSGLDFQAVYTTAGVEGRNSHQMGFFRMTANNFQFPCHEITEIPTELSGATYLVRMQNDKVFGFALRAFQANTEDEAGRTWRVAFGELGQSQQLDDMIHELNEFFDENQIPQLRI